MEQKLNIAEILKNKPRGTKLYDLLRNIELELDSISYTDYENIIWCRYNDVDPCDLYKYSIFGTERGWLNGLQILLPSKEMRDWSKFAWQKGDILVNENNAHIIFEKFTDDTYTTFIGRHYFDGNNKSGYSYISGRYTACTQQFHIEEGDAIQTYISNVEKEIGGKLNLKTLEGEKGQLEFKDGDIVTMHKKNCDIVFIFNRLRTEGSFYYYAFHALQTNNTGVIDCHITLPYAWTFFESKMNFATDSEKQQLFDALAKEGKAWDTEKKQIVDLKLKWTPKPFDKVVVRCGEADKWSIDFFSYKVSNGYICTGDAWFGYCLPYNEETAKLVGTTKDVEG